MSQLSSSFNQLQYQLSLVIWAESTNTSSLLIPGIPLGKKSIYILWQSVDRPGQPLERKINKEILQIEALLIRITEGKMFLSRVRTKRTVRNLATILPVLLQHSHHYTYGHSVHRLSTMRRETKDPLSYNNTELNVFNKAQVKEHRQHVSFKEGELITRMWFIYLYVFMCRYMCLHVTICVYFSELYLSFRCPFIDTAYNYVSF